MTTLPEIIGAFVTDTFGLVGIPGGSVAAALTIGYFHRRDELARDILFEELRLANITDARAASEDDAIAVIVRYLRAAREGAARLNIRLLAKVIAGQVRSGSLVADEFLQYAEALASLSRDEIIVIGTLHRISDAYKNLAVAATDPVEAHKYVDPWLPTQRELTNMGMSEELVATAAARAQRSGLIYGVPGPAYPSQNPDLSSLPGYRISPLLADLARTVDFEDALRKEAARRD